MIRLKQALGLAGILVGLGGIGLDNRVVVWVAIGMLGASVVIRIALAVVERRRQA
jgi:hypothetical protein